jgi:uncharacterized delta-60 repeat protein
VGSTRAAATGFEYDFAVVRYNSDGSLDRSFGGVGYVITPFGSLDGAFSVLIQGDGRIVAAGVANAGSPETAHLALARYNPDGSLDGSFDADGKVEGQAGWAWSVAIDAGGKLVVAAGIVARYNANGTLDAGFGSNGKVDLVQGSSARVVLMQPDRTLVVAGALQTPDNKDFLIARLEPDGSYDTSFGDRGRVHTDLGTNSYDEALAAVLLSDRRIVVAGRTQPTSQSGPLDFALARYVNPAPCKVPNVRGKKLAGAKASIRKARCSVGRITRKPSKRSRKGRVLSQRPKAGTTLAVGGKVNLVVGKGRRR